MFMQTLSVSCGFVVSALMASQQQSFSSEHSLTSAEPRTTGRFLHVTDFHPDWFYRQGAKLSELCHLEPDDQFLQEGGSLETNTLKKDHKETRAGFWGPPPNTECDSPIQLVNATFNYIQRVLVERQGGLDFVIWTGDNARHDNDNRFPRTLDQIYSSNEFMKQKMQEIFGSDKDAENFIPVVPTVGNNDVYPHNIMFAGPNSKTITAYKSMWRAWVPREQLHTFDRGAYFHTPVAPKLSVVSLNSLYFYENNKAVDGCSSKDEAGSLQLEWLAIQLSLFRLQKTFVWIIGHIPPTERQWYDGCYNSYANLVIEYRDIIVGQLFGHVNIDHFYFLNYRQSNHPHSLKGQDCAQDALPDKEVHLLKNPLDVLTEARDNFDQLPALSKTRKYAEDELDARIGHLAVVSVGPSVVPNYYPTLRVYEYLTSDTVSSSAVYDSMKKHKKKRKKRPAPPPVGKLGPAYIPQKFTPMKYTQLYFNTTDANLRSATENIDYQVEYETSASPYAMPDLTVGSYVRLGHEISGLYGHGKVQTAHIMENDILANMTGLVEDDFVESVPLDFALGRRKGKKKKSKRRNNGFWKVFVYRGFVSTGAEHDY